MGNSNLLVLMSGFLKGTLLVFASITTAFAADNPCGVSCSQTIANNASITALSQANQFTLDTAQTTLAQAKNYTDDEIDTRVYEKIVIYAENASSIVGAAATQWAFGDGDVGTGPNGLGIPLVEDWEIYAVSFQARSVTQATNVKMAVKNMNTATDITTFVANLGTTASTAVYTQFLLNPVPIPAGTTIGFTTMSVSAGVVTGARAAVWLRRHPV